MEKLTKDQRQAKRKYDYAVRALTAHKYLSKLEIEALKDDLGYIILEYLPKQEWKSLLAHVAASNPQAMKAIKTLASHPELAKHNIQEL